MCLSFLPKFKVLQRYNVTERCTTLHNVSQRHTTLRNVACEQALRSRMGRKESARERWGWRKGKRRGREILILPQALLGSLRSPISLRACSQAIRNVTELRGILRTLADISQVGSFVLRLYLIQLKCPCDQIFDLYFFTCSCTTRRPYSSCQISIHYEHQKSFYFNI